MISADGRPQLARKARLRFDRRTERYVLLYPERGLELNATAAEIVKLCTGEHTVRAIVAHLMVAHAEAPPEVVEREALGFLEILATRGLVAERT